MLAISQSQSRKIVEFRPTANSNSTSDRASRIQQTAVFNVTTRQSDPEMGEEKGKRDRIRSRRK